MSDLDKVELDFEHFLILEDLGNRYDCCILYRILYSISYLILSRWQQYQPDTINILVRYRSRLMRLYALNSLVKVGDRWTAFRSMPGDSAIIREDQIRKCIYCWRRRRLSVKLQRNNTSGKKKERERKRKKGELFVWLSRSIFPRALDRK